MKIISKFTDYYDKMRCYANPVYCSDDFMYIRKTKNATIPQDKIVIHTIHNSTYNKHDVIRNIIGFCGQWYFVYKIKVHDNYYNPENEYKNYLCFTNIRDVLKYNWKIKTIKKHYNSNTWEYSDIFRKFKQDTIPKTIEKVIQRYELHERLDLQKYTTYLNKLDLFKKYNTPTLLISSSQEIRKHTLTINPCLKELNFFNILEGNLAYQEIEMFLGNELLPQDDAEQITDNLILAANHGFNKASFRKPPSKAEKRAKRKANKSKKRMNKATK